MPDGGQFFYVNVPIGVVALVLGTAAIPESKAVATRIDLKGAMLLGGGLFLLILPLVIFALPALRRELTAAGVPAGQQQPIASSFRACFSARAHAKTRPQSLLAPGRALHRAPAVRLAAKGPARR